MVVRRLYLQIQAKEKQLVKMVYIVYNAAIDEEVMACLERCRIESYTKIPTVHGAGKLSGPHMGTHVWPASNSMLLIACEDDVKDHIVEEMGNLKRAFEREGIKVFVMPLEEIV